MSPYEQRLLSRPVDLHWAGWRSDTLSLQQAGWSISAHQDMCRMQMGLAVRHDQFGAGLSVPLNWEYIDDRWDRHLPPVYMQVMGRQVNVTVMGAPNYATAYAPVDAVPQFLGREVRNLEDMVHFAPSLARTRELYVPEENVEELMKRILDLQQPTRIERIKQSLRDQDGQMIDARPRQKFHAQILSLVA